MRYLNKIIFINSATISYAEIALDGNIHFVGTQGVGKSTLLRAILFFYNADKTKLGIAREKKNFEDYYFEYENSYIIYEVVKANQSFCILAFKKNNRIAFRFIDSPYRREFFIAEDGLAFTWSEIRAALGTEISYVRKTVESYKEYRKIIYGDNADLEPRFKPYALLETKQFHNIPLTIQNVLLNSKLEAPFIKHTIIQSLNEDQFQLNLAVYARHLRRFKIHVQDLRTWFRGQKENQAQNIIAIYKTLNHLKNEKETLATNLIRRLNYLNRELPELIDELELQQLNLRQFVNNLEELEHTHKASEKEINGHIYLQKAKLREADQKRTTYETKNIETILEQVARKPQLLEQIKAKQDEKTLLTSKFLQIDEKYKALIARFNNQKDALKNQLQAATIQRQTAFNHSKSELNQSYNQQNQVIKDSYKTALDKLEQDKKKLNREREALHERQIELKYKPFHENAIRTSRSKIHDLSQLSAESQTKIEQTTNQIEHQEQRLAFEVEKIKRKFELKITEAKQTRQNYEIKLNKLEQNIQSNKHSFYSWLNENQAGWENTIGKVIAEEVLFNEYLHPKLNEEADKSSLFGLTIDLKVLKSRVKSLQTYQTEIENLKKEIKAINQTITQLGQDKLKTLHNLDLNFKSKIKTYQTNLTQAQTTLTETDNLLEKTKTELKDWQNKAELEKENQKVALQTEISQIQAQKKTLDQSQETIRTKIKTKIQVQKQKFNAELKAEEDRKNAFIKTKNEETEIQIKLIDNRIAEIKNQKYSELEHEQTYTQRLNELETELQTLTTELTQITQQEKLVIEYEKDKRELFDKIPQFEQDLKALQKHEQNMLLNHKRQLEKLKQKQTAQAQEVKSLHDKRTIFQADLDSFKEFRKTFIYRSIVHLLNDKGKIKHSDKATTIISKIENKHAELDETFRILRKRINSFTGVFDEDNLFKFKVKFGSDDDYIAFAENIWEFIEEEKIEEYRKRTSETYSEVITLIAKETDELFSKQTKIQSIIKQINADFSVENFVEAIRRIDLRVRQSSNKIVKILSEIKDFHQNNELYLSGLNLFSGSKQNTTNEAAILLLERLVNAVESHLNSRKPFLTLADSFDLQFKIIENDNDSGWVEKITNIGSEGTDILIKAMFNILLLNVFKEGASKAFKDFKLHCMMDEVGRLHPSNVKGILKFANERNILLINASPISQSAYDYRHTYQLSKQPSKSNSDKYITVIKRLISVSEKNMTSKNIDH